MVSHFANASAVDVTLILMNACLLKNHLARVRIGALDPGWVLLLEATFWSSVSKPDVADGRVHVLESLAKLTWIHMIKELA